MASDQTVHLSGLHSSDAEPLSRIHMLAFPDFFLSRLGHTFLKYFYRGFLGADDVVAVVARDSQGRPVGAAVGPLDPEGFFGRLLRRRLMGFVRASTIAAVRQPRAIPRLVRAVTYRGVSSARTSGALLSSICVEPGRRGTGLGSLLLIEWEEEARARGATVAHLTTDADSNHAVNDFYAHHGWQCVDQFATREGRIMNTYVKSLRPTNGAPS